MQPRGLTASWCGARDWFAESIPGAREVLLGSRTRASSTRPRSLGQPRTRSRGEFLEDAKLVASDGYFAVSAFSAALAAAKVSAPSEYEHAYRRERVWQSEWIARQLIAT